MARPVTADAAHAAIRAWARHAAAAFGDDLPVAPARRIRLPDVAPVDAPPAAGLPAVEVAVPPAPVTPIRPIVARPAGARAAERAATERAATQRPGATRARPGPSAANPATRPAGSPDAHGDAAETGLPTDLEALRRVVTPCRRCKLCETRTQTVFGEGSPHADVLFVGEAPGAREDELGRPFVGPAGTLLTKIVENAMGLRRSDVYIANVNKCRPPNNRNPEPDEIAACLPFLRAQIRTIAPKVIVALGRVAAHNLLGTSASMGQLRGRPLEYEGIPVVATWHPAYLLRQPEAKRETWEDIKRVNRLLGRPEVPPARGAAPGSADA